jgi:hypothetical protein
MRDALGLKRKIWGKVTNLFKKKKILIKWNCILKDHKRLNKLDYTKNGH